MEGAPRSAAPGVLRPLPRLSWGPALAPFALNLDFDGSWGLWDAENPSSTAPSGAG